jgi:WD40 repeat protein
MDGRYIASGCNPWQIVIWNVRTGKLVASWEGHPGLVSGVVLTPDGKGLLSASWDNEIIHWDISSLRLLEMADLLTSEIKEVSRLVGHTVRRSYSLFILLFLILPAHPFNMQINTP